MNGSMRVAMPMTDDANRPTALGRLLKAAREERGFSRTRLSQLTGVTAITIEGWENGRVRKPPIHDVLRLSRALSLATGELERAVWEDASPVSEDVLEPVLTADPPSVGRELLQRATALRAWTSEDAAAALNTTPSRLKRLREGEDEFNVVEMMALIAVLAAYPAGEGGAGRHEVSELLARLRGASV